MNTGNTAARTDTSALQNSPPNSPGVVITINHFVDWNNLIPITVTDIMAVHLSCFLFISLTTGAALINKKHQMFFFFTILAC